MMLRTGSAVSHFGGCGVASSNAPLSVAKNRRLVDKWDASTGHSPNCPGSPPPTGG